MQGDFLEHQQVLRRIGVEAPEVRLPEHLQEVDALIIPGGESTTIVQLMDIYGISEPLKARARQGMPVWGTCAGMIVLADRLTDDRPEPLHLMDIEVSRNAFGRQVDSFETDLTVEGLKGPPFRAVFIRAPVITQVGPQVQVLARLEDGRAVAVRQGNLLATAFHPELTEDTRFHEMFVGVAEDAGKR